MRYRLLKNTDVKLSQLGFGTMRLPILHDNEKLIDKERASELLQYAIDHGVNYYDTAWNYHLKASESFLGEFLHETGQREKVYVATKLPCWECREYADFDRLLDRQLENLKTDYIDFYLLHALDSYRFNKIHELGVADFMNKAKASGKVRYMGFSFHDDYEAFRPILDAYPFDFAQIQYNYMDDDFQAGDRGLRDIANKGISSVIMEPLRGGQIVKKPVGKLKEIWDSFQTDLTPAALALKYVLNREEVTTLLSGMGTMEEIVENIRICSEYGVGSLTEKEMDMIRVLRDYYRNETRVDCTACNYCNDCPEGIPISRIFTFYNEAHIYGDAANMREKYKKNVKNKHKANQCVECGQCEEACPQNLPIREDLKKAHSFLMDS